MTSSGKIDKMYYIGDIFKFYHRNTHCIDNSKCYKNFENYPYLVISGLSLGLHDKETLERYYEII